MEDFGKYGFNDDDKEQQITGAKAQLRALLAISEFKRLIPFLFMYLSCSFMPLIFITAYGAQWLSNCDTINHSDDADDKECEFNYKRYQFYNSLVLSIRGLMAFIFGTYIGHLSDEFGRKTFLLLQVFAYLLPFACLAFLDNLWLYFAFFGLSGIFGGQKGQTSIMIAYISDIIPNKHLRIMGYSCVHAIGGLSLFIGAVFAMLFSYIVNKYYSNNQTIFFVVICIFYCIQLIYVYFFIKESIHHHHDTTNIKNSSLHLDTNLKDSDIEMNSNINIGGTESNYISKCCNMTTKNLNIFSFVKDLFKLENPIIFWIALVEFIISLPDIGVLDTVMVYTLDTFSITNENESHVLLATLMIISGFGLSFAMLVILPFIKKYPSMTDLSIVLIGVCTMMIAMLLYALLYYIKKMIILICASILITSSFMAFPAANAIVTKNVLPIEQGMAFGIISSIKGITFMIAPFTFGFAYNLLAKRDKSYLLYIFAALLCFAVIPIILGPLRKVLKDAQLNGTKYYLTKTSLKKHTQSTVDAIDQELQRLNVSSSELETELTDASDDNVVL